VQLDVVYVCVSVSVLCEGEKGLYSIVSVVGGVGVMGTRCPDHCIRKTFEEKLLVEV
jgi:hypothetical protein